MPKYANATAWIFAVLLIVIFGVQTFAAGPQKKTPDAEDTTNAIVDLQQRVAKLEQWQTDTTQKHKDLAGTVEKLDKATDTLTKRVEQLDQNDMRQAKRDIDAINRAMDDLKNRVRRLE